VRQIFLCPCCGWNNIYVHFDVLFFNNIGYIFCNFDIILSKKNTCVSANPGAVLYTGDNEGISLKRPVVQRGSILLAELVAILMVLEQFQHCIAALKDGFTDIKILSDSQTAVGILTQLEVIKLH
jgi:hypothetical protein